MGQLDQQSAAFERQWAEWMLHESDVMDDLEIRGKVLDEEPPRVTLGRRGVAELHREVTISLGRGDDPSVVRTDHLGERVSVRQAASMLGINGPQMNGAQAAVLDGLEQSERAAGRTPADRAPRRASLSDLDGMMEEGLAVAAATLRGKGINVEELAWPGQRAVLSERSVRNLTDQGRSATAVVHDWLRSGPTEDATLESVGLLTANPWDQSVQRAAVERAVDERLVMMGLPSRADRLRAAFDGEGPRGVQSAVAEVGRRIAELEAGDASRRAQPVPVSTLERNRRRMESATRCGIQQESAVTLGGEKGPKFGR